MTTARHIAFTAVLAVLGVAPSLARAQKANIDAELFRPAATGGGTLQLDDGFMPSGRFALSGSLWIDYAYNPLVLRDATGTQQGVVIGNMVDANLAFSVSLRRRLEVGLLLPVLLSQDHDDTQFHTPGGLSSTALGDLRLEAKVRLGEITLGVPQLGVPQLRLGFALAASLGLPTGDDNAFFGDGGVTFRPRAMATLRYLPVTLTLQVGATIRASRVVGDLELGQQLQLGLGARVAIWRGLGVVGTVLSQIELSGTSSTSTTPVDFLAGPEYRFAHFPVEVTLAAGRGITSGYGAPDARVVFALRYQPRDYDHDFPPDRDGDRVLDREDRCPDIAGPIENQGCPWPDRDGDGVLDKDDRCPDVVGPKENHGCPDKDSDGDGLIDRQDHCPDVAGPKEHRTNKRAFPDLGW